LPIKLAQLRKTACRAEKRAQSREMARNEGKTARRAGMNVQAENSHYPPSWFGKVERSAKSQGRDRGSQQDT
jgi:hypothetical protein